MNICRHYLYGLLFEKNKAPLAVIPGGQKEQKQAIVVAGVRPESS